jgi:hypothetical protein
MTEIDFLPREYWQRRQSHQYQWYLLGLGVACLGLLLASYVHESSRARLLQRQLEEVQEQHRLVMEGAQEIQRLEELRRPLAFESKLYALLRARPAFSRAMAAVSTSCPSRLSLESVRVRPIRLNRSSPKTGVSSAASAATSNRDSLAEQLERFSAERSSTRIAIELMGRAYSDLEVAEFIERLEAAGCFSDVSLSAVDYQSAGISELREFKIQCRLTEVL